VAKEFRKARQAGVSFYELRIRVNTVMKNLRYDQTSNVEGPKKKFVLARCWTRRESGKRLSARQTFLHDLAKDVEKELVCFLDSGG
jgi:hypothetical protein